VVHLKSSEPNLNYIDVSLADCDSESGSPRPMRSDHMTATKNKRIQILLSGLTVCVWLSSCTNNLSATALNSSRFVKENPQVITQIGKLLNSRSQP
jgi:hypothetical protein